MSLLVAHRVILLPRTNCVGFGVERTFRPVNALDMNPAVLHGFDVVCDLDELARGSDRGR